MLFNALESIVNILKWFIYKLRSLFSRSDQLEIVYQSNNYIIVNKKYDVRINSNDVNDKTSIHYILFQKYPLLANSKLKHYFYFVHRLDYATSGILCIALNKKACAEASATFQQRLANKFYLAILRGHVSKDHLEISTPIGECLEDNGINKMGTEKSGVALIKVRPACTRMLVLERGLFARYPATKVLLMPVTGRRHQLRVHCSHIGHTIVGDYTYSNKKDITPHRQYLHSYKLILPSKLEALDIETADPFPPSDLLTGWWPVELINSLNGQTLYKMNLSP